MYTVKENPRRHRLKKKNHYVPLSTSSSPPRHLSTLNRLIGCCVANVAAVLYADTHPRSGRYEQPGQREVHGSSGPACR